MIWRPTKRGFTLYEVVLALVIFSASMLALGQLISVGTRAAIQSRFQTRAVLLCESKLAEVIAGAETLDNVNGASFETEDETWSWDVSIGSSAFPDVLLVQVTVNHIATNENSNVSYTLSRLVRDASVYAAVEEDDESG